MVCNRGSHPLASYNQFQGMTNEQLWDVIKKGAQSKKRLKSGHMVSKCCAPPMCKKCHKYHHTLLHMEADPKLEDRKESSSSMTYVEPSKQGEEVLLMTCWVKVTAPNGSIRQARALLDCAASTSLIIECLAQQLRLPRRSSNFTVNGVTGIDAHLRGTISFKVARV